MIPYHVLPEGIEAVVIGKDGEKREMFGASQHIGELNFLRNASPTTDGHQLDDITSIEELKAQGVKRVVLTCYHTIIVED